MSSTDNFIIARNLLNKGTNKIVSIFEKNQKIEINDIFPNLSVKPKQVSQDLWDRTVTAINKLKLACLDIQKKAIQEEMDYIEGNDIVITEEDLINVTKVVCTKEIDPSILFDDDDLIEETFFPIFEHLLENCHPGTDNKFGAQVTYYTSDAIDATIFTESSFFADTVEESLVEFEKILYNIYTKYGRAWIRAISLIYFKHLPKLDLLGNGTNKVKPIYSVKKFSEFDENHLIYNPLSRTNCFYQAICVTLTPKIVCETYYSTVGKRSRGRLQKSAEVLKSSCKITNKLTCEEDIIKVCKHKKIDLEIYDISMNLIQRFDYGSGAPAKKVICYDQHYYALIEKISLDRSNTSLIHYQNKDIISKPEKNLLEKCHKEKDQIKNFMTGDLEAYKNQYGNFCSYASGICWGYGKTERKIFIGEKTCLSETFDFIFEEILEPNKPLVLYYHNGGKFDVNLLISEFFVHQKKYDFQMDKKIFLNGRIMKLPIVCENKTLILQDSYCLLNGTLADLTSSRGFDVEHKKMEDIMDHRSINVDNYQKIMSEHGKQYLINDCVGLFECVDIFADKMWDCEKINITKCVSGASISKRCFKTHYYDPKKFPIELLSPEINSFIRPTFHGGRTESFFKGILKGKYYYFDFTSLYPAAGTYDMPYGTGRKILSIKKGDMIDPKKHMRLFETFATFMQVEVVTLKKDLKPLHCETIDGKLVFPIFETPTIISTTGLEIESGLKKGQYSYKFIDGYFFKKAPILKSFFENAFEKKCQAKKDGQPVLEFLYKLIANSGYGWFALKDKGTDIDLSTNEESFLTHLVKGSLKDVYKFGSRIVTTYEKSMVEAEKNIAIGSYITAQARVMIHNLLVDIEQCGGKIYYMDTDSVICDIDVINHPKLAPLYCADGTGEGLGYLKNEITEKITKVCKKEGIEQNDDVNYITTLACAGAKSYHWSSSFIDKKGKTWNISDSKLKGFKQNGDKFTPVEYNVKRLGIESYQDLLDGGKITQQQEQFISNKRGTQQKWMNIKTQEKSFKYQYNKGIHNKNGFITPIIV